MTADALDHVNNPDRPRGRPFAKGNPGRPRGSRNKARVSLERLLEGEAEALTRRAISAALGGDIPALRMCMDRLLPVRRDRHITYTLPRLETAADAVQAASALVEAVAVGELTPSEAGDLAKLVETFTRAVEVHDLEHRIGALEDRSAPHERPSR